MGPQVAPFTGAWIETGCYTVYAPLAEVAPFTGAWIETVREWLELRST